VYRAGSCRGTQTIKTRLLLMLLIQLQGSAQRKTNLETWCCCSYMWGQCTAALALLCPGCPTSVRVPPRLCPVSPQSQQTCYPARPRPSRLARCSLNPQPGPAAVAHLCDE
jgi:hypothetical protein